ncbi:MAG: 3-phosphoserine/phosphohydroxythreonine transaminase [Clostridia bacterium]|nr:3-phosphoserine/phosphohydroxythreonine transaminase [Clostridia bacterium]
MPYEVTQELVKSISQGSPDAPSPLEFDYTTEKFGALIRHAEETLRTLLHIPVNYRVLFMAGGEDAQFSAVPLNLLSDHKCADYVVTGVFSKEAYLEGKKYGDMNIAASSAGASPAFSSVPEMSRSDFRPDADYVHICYNNPVYGTSYRTVPETGSIPLVADMSSCFLSAPVNVSDFGLIYAAAGQNYGISGVTTVIVRDDLVGNAADITPSVLNYETMSDKQSVFRAPDTFALTVADAVFTHILNEGGLEEMKRRNESKVSLIYDYLDSQVYYTATVDKKYRSSTHVVFVTGNSAMDERFLQAAEEAGLYGLRGHSAVGGIRASLYNSMPYEGAEALIEFMKKFAMQNPKLDF